MNDHTVTISDRVAVSRRQCHSYRFMSPKSSRPTSSTPKRSILKTWSPEELSLTGILGQIRINYEYMDEFGKVGAEMSYLLSQTHSDCDSAESIADSDLEDGELRKMLESRRLRISNANCTGETWCIATGKRSKCKAYSS